MFGSPFGSPRRPKDEPKVEPYPKCPHGDHEWHGEETWYCPGSFEDDE